MNLSLEANANDSTGFQDDKDIPAWARGAVAAIKRMGYMKGKGSNHFDPSARTKRAEAVTVLLKLLTQRSN
ncbi:S-layer homology domain-containing protein [Paenibacillus sp. MAHUQ-46]|uniref:S-layer homology domain-containing protein n=1 Tax=Paenibacillus roseus TaxID=2798579 RepID=A0A934MVV5_9BACL|nr:S-layer homology domain-containing protein [Paenibacillus roseus]